MSRRYDGILAVGAGDDGDYVDIDPPIPDGQVGILTGCTFSFVTTDTANDYIQAGVSVQATGRTSCSVTSDGFPADLLALRYENFVLQTHTSLYQSIVTLIKDGFLFQDGYVAETPVLYDKLRVFIKVASNVAAGKTLYVAYELHIQEVKRTNELQNLLWQKQYT